MLHDLQGLGSLTTIWRHFSDTWDMYEEDAGGVTLAYMKGGVPTLKILQQSSNDELGPELRAWHERCRKITWLSSIII